MFTCAYQKQLLYSSSYTYIHWTSYYILHIRHFGYVRRDLTRRENVARWVQVSECLREIHRALQVGSDGIWCWLLVVP